MLKICTLHNTNKILYYITYYSVCTYTEHYVIVQD